MYCSLRQEYNLAIKKNNNKIIWPVTQWHLEFFSELFVFAALSAWSLLSNHKKILANMLLLWFLFRARLPPLSLRISVGINITNRSRTLALEHYSIFPKWLSSLFSIHKSLPLLPGIFPASLRPHLNVSNLRMIAELFKWYAKISFTAHFSNWSVLYLRPALLAARSADLY